MQTKPKKELTPFAEAAFKLDDDFQERERLSKQIEAVGIESDAGFERGRNLLVQFGECSSRIGSEIQSLSSSLEDSRSRAEKAANIAANRAAEIQLRFNKTSLLTERFNQLAALVKTVSDGIAHFKKPAGQKISEEEKTFLSAKLPELDVQLSELRNQALQLKDDARSHNMKMLEKNADSLGQVLDSARQKLSRFQ